MSVRLHGGKSYLLPLLAAALLKNPPAEIQGKRATGVVIDEQHSSGIVDIVKEFEARHRIVEPVEIYGDMTPRQSRQLAKKKAKKAQKRKIVR